MLGLDEKFDIRKFFLKNCLRKKLYFEIIFQPKN